MRGFGHCKIHCADLGWNEFVKIIKKLDEADFDISDLLYHERCNILTSNSVLRGNFL